MSLKVTARPENPALVYCGDTDIVVGTKTENSLMLIFPKYALWFKKTGENTGDIQRGTYFSLGFQADRFFSATTSTLKSVGQLARLVRLIENIEKGHEELPSKCFPWSPPVTLESLKENRDQKIQRLFNLLEPSFSAL